MNSICVIIEPETADYLQALYYEYNSYKDILMDILHIKNGYEHNIDTYNKFMEEYKFAYTKFHLVREEVIRQYANEANIGDSYEYDFDFYNRTLTIKGI